MMSGSFFISHYQEKLFHKEAEYIITICIK